MYPDALRFLDTLKDSVSSYGGDIDQLIWTIFYITGFFFVVMEALLLYFIFRYRASRPGPAEHLPGDTLKSWTWVLVLGALVLIIDLSVDAMGAKVWTKIKEEVPAEDLRVRVWGQQFSWDFQYPGKDGKLDTADDVHVVNELHVPVNKKVRLDLRSKDVIHSLFLPDARFKQDLLPGREIPAWIEITSVGETRLYCAELCGQAHTAMIGTLIAHDDKGFQAWMKEQR